MEVKLINFMRKNNYLHDRTSLQYRDMELKTRKWKEISGEVGVEVKQLQKRWRTLRDRFKREHQNNLQANRKVKWVYYKPLSFLLYDCNEPPSLKAEAPLDISDHQHAESYEQEETTTACLEKEIPSTSKQKSEALNGDDILEEFILFEKTTQEAPASTRTVKAFFSSMVIQVEEAGLTFERFAFMQHEILKIVNAQIREQRQEQSTTAKSCQNFDSA